MDTKFSLKEYSTVSRRDFIKSSASLVGGALIGSLPVGASAYVSGSDLLKVALVGCGGRGTGAAVQAIRTEGPVELVAMADVFRDKLDSSYDNLMNIPDIKEFINVPEERKFVGFDAYKHAIAEADVVILATPPGFRPAHFEECVNTGKHVFLEKPLASDAPGIRKILAAGEKAREKNLSIVVGLQNRYDVGFNKLVEQIKQGSIGELLSAKCNYMIGDLVFHPRKTGQTEMEYQVRNWHYFNWLWAGAPAGLMIHFTDIVHWAKGSYPVRAHGTGGLVDLSRPERGEIYDHFYIEYEYEDGFKLYSEIRHIDGIWNNRGVTFQGTQGTASERNGVRNLKGETVWRHRGMDDLDAYQVEHDKLFASIRNGNGINDTEWGAKSSMASILGRMAVHSGQVIEWDDAFQSDLSLVPEVNSFDMQPPILLKADGTYPVPMPGRTKVL